MSRTIPRRSSKDIAWQHCKAIVDKRDLGCQVVRCLTLREANKLKKENLGRLDRAHMASSGNYPEFTYFPANIRKISHLFHQRLDQYQDLVTGEAIESNARYWWCWRIMKHSTEEYDTTKDYEVLVLDVIRQDVTKFEP